MLEEGVFAASEAGTPQGGLVSPVLANIYLHYVLDCGLRNVMPVPAKGGRI